MIETPYITESAEQLTACIPMLIPRAEIMTAMGPAICEVYAALTAQGIAPVGPLFTHHRRRPTDTFDFSVCIPIATPVTAVGRVTPGKLPASNVARTIYTGPYEGLAGAWEELCTWVESNGHTPREELWEAYIFGPESSPDPASWRTELNRPLVG